mmetsp:Transcript_4580/g.12511  ORF Transcript_4580/g.12511 Transcript_4580/m.12511 type:complete len:85 (-) Transcript_4580:2267-2521(-)|eukprot:1148829-Pelagomonas_calceolata.AAC.5
MHIPAWPASPDMLHALLSAGRGQDTKHAGVIEKLAVHQCGQTERVWELSVLKSAPAHSNMLMHASPSPEHHTITTAGVMSTGPP